MTEIDFSYLAGKTIKVIGNDGSELEGFVVGCDYDIGITIVEKENKDNFLVCINGACSPLSRIYFNKIWYDRVFFPVVEQIINGELSFKRVQEAVLKNNEVPKFVKRLSKDTCSFGQ